MHLEATVGEEVLVALRRAWPGALIMNPVAPMGPKQTSRDDADHWLGQGADLAYYEGGDAGYLTYSAHQYAA